MSEARAFPDPEVKDGRVVYLCPTCGTAHEFATTAVLCELTHEGED